MIHSMTAFARKTTQQSWGQAIWECRSVNHRYLDLTFKLPDIFREWEAEFRQCVSAQLQRGKVECTLTFIAGAQTAPQLQINTDLVKQLVSSCEQLGQAGIDPTLKALDLLRWPGVITTQAADISILKTPIIDLLKQTLVDLNQARQREGQQIQHFIQDKLSKVAQQVVLVQERLPQCIQAQKQKLTQKVTEISESLNRDRLEQELIYLAQRADVAEEMDRLNGHVKEVSRIIQEKGASGRRLDFLMQEMNREANTLGSKSLDEIVTNASVELKVFIEQMREQIQNVE